MFWKKNATKLGKLQLGVDVRRCSECQSNHRPCLVDGKPAMFLRWADEDRAFIRMNLLISECEQRSIWREFQRTGYVPSGCSAEVQRVTVALVEYPDGSVGTVRPHLVTFLDRKEG